MPSIEQNRQRWSEEYSWHDDGEEWSAAWGGHEAQWQWTILPRIARFLPAGRILEIAPGNGRWTAHLIPLCQQLIGIDIAEGCLATCRRRFHGAQASFLLGDGVSLAGVADSSIDFAFSFDSLVHAEMDVLALYLKELRRVLRPEGAAFLHHSNLGSLARHYAWASRIPRGRRVLSWFGLAEVWYHWRASTVGASSVADAASGLGLRCLGQEEVTWHTRRPIDCFTTLAQAGSHWQGDGRRLCNTRFMQEAAQVRQLSRLYHPAPAAQGAQSGAEGPASGSSAGI